MTAAAQQSGERPEPDSGRRALILLRECLAAALAHIAARPQRSILSTLGIGVGVTAVVAVVALMQSLSHTIADQFLSMGSNTLTVRADTPLEQANKGRRNRLTLTDLEHVRRRIDPAHKITPLIELDRPYDIRHGAAMARVPVMGTTELYQEVQQAYPRHGRFLTASDDRFRRRVAVLGDKLRRDLKLPADPVGRYITVGSEWFRVVGVMEPRGEILGGSRDSFLLIPFDTAVALQGAVEQPELSIHIAVADLGSSEAVKGQVESVLRQRHNIRPGQAQDFVVESAASLQASFAEISLAVTLVVSGIVGVSLLVGGIGIMNVMLISVTERTREIGIAKALGAPERYILTQFVLEAVALSLIGGAAGIVAGYALALGIGRSIPDFQAPSLPWWGAVGALAFACLVGIIFGWAPARRAAGLQPVEALRYE